MTSATGPSSVTAPQRPRRPAPPADESIKETLESIVIAFVLAFVFRAYVVEAFVIPTGSMAPTLLGRHLAVSCSQCGYRFTSDTPNQDDRQPALQHKNYAICPMCHYPNHLDKATTISNGDRILVHKYIYNFSEPRRWDVVVFKNPQLENQDGSPGPTANFIKRLVGLPEESLWIIEGNLYVKPLGTDEDAWQIARKTDRPKVQRAVWQPIYDSSHHPLDAGTDSLGRGRYPWVDPWSATQPQHWQPVHRLGYRHTTAQPGRLHFDFKRAVSGGPGPYPYNQFKSRQLHAEPIEEIRLAADFIPDQPGLAVRLSTTARLDDPAGRMYRLIASIDDAGRAQLMIDDPSMDQPRPLGDSVDIGPFQPGRARHVELWYVDQEASLWVQGRRILARQFDTPIRFVKTRPDPPLFPDTAIEVSGSPVRVYRLQIDRDLYYAGQNHSRVARGAYIKGSSQYPSKPLNIKADQFFCVGDNNPASLDGRYWDDLDPWVDRRHFDPDESMSEKLGIVPRRLMMGRAFFVYWPAPLKINPTSTGIVLNFGDMRFIH